MAITVDDTSDDIATSNTILSIAHVAGTGSDRYMVVGHGNSSSGGGSTPDSVVYDATDTLSEVQGQTAVSGTYNGIWDITANSQTSGNLVVTLPTTEDELSGGVLTLFGVDQTTPHDTPETANGSSASVTDDVTSETGDLVFDSMYIVSDADAHTQSADSGQTEYYNQVHTGWVGGGGSYENGASTVTMSWTIGESVSWETIAMNINAASGGGGSTPERLTLLGVS